MCVAIINNLKPLIKLILSLILDVQKQTKQSFQVNQTTLLATFRYQNYMDLIRAQVHLYLLITVILTL